MTTGQSIQKVVVETTAETERTMRTQKVPVNVYETSGALVVIAPLPAVTADDVTIDLRPGTLRFYAHLRSSGPRDYLVHEWEYGGYEREIEVPTSYGAGIYATLMNGHLAIRVLRGEGHEALTTKPNTV